MEVELRNEIFRQLTYSPDNGWFMWLKDSNNKTPLSLRHKAGSKAGHIHPEGYIHIRIPSYGKYAAHRLAFVFMKRDWPVNEVDHINGVRSDNRWCNLRDVSDTENQYNAKIRTDNRSGVRGVFWNEPNRKWQVQIRYKGKAIHLGLYVRKEDAVAARREAEKRYRDGD